MRSVWLQVVETGAVRVYGMAVSLLCLIISARLLGPSGQGTLVATSSWVSTFAALSGLSLGQVAQFRIQARRSENWLPELFGTLLGLGAIASTAGAIAAFGVFVATHGSAFRGIPGTILALGFLLLPLLLWDDYASNLLGSAERLRSYNLAQTAGKTVWLVVLVVLVWMLELGVAGALFAQIVGQGVSMLIGFMTLFFVTRRKVRFVPAEAKLLLSGAGRLHLNTIGSLLLAQTSVLALNHFSTKVDVAQYQIAFQLVTVLLLLPQAAATVIFSRMAKLGPDRVWPEHKRLMLQVMGVTATVALVAYVLGPKLIATLLGGRYADATDTFRTLLLIPLGLGLAQIMTPQWIARGLFVQTTAITFITGVANVVAHLVLVPRFGPVAAVWSNLVCYAGLTTLVQSAFAMWCDREHRRTILAESKV